MLPSRVRAVENYRDKINRLLTHKTLTGQIWTLCLDTLLDPTERQTVNKAITTSVEGSTASGLLQGTVTQIFPLENPRWDPNIPEHMARLKWYQSFVVYGLNHGVPKAINLSKLYEVRQNYDESPTDFLNRLRETAIKYWSRPLISWW